VSIGTSELVTPGGPSKLPNLVGVRDDVMIGEDIASAADIADCGRAAGSGAGMRTSEANTPTYFDERVVIFGPELLSSSFGARARLG